MMGRTYLDYTTRFDTENAYYLLRSGDVGGYTAMGLTVSEDIAADGASASGFWVDQVQKTRLDFRGVPGDLSGYTTLIMNIYSQCASGATFTLCITCPKNAEGKYPYKKFEGAIDWVGWKQFVIPIVDMFGAYNPDMSNVIGMRWNADGWSNVPNPDSKLYFDSVYFVGTVYDFNMDTDSIGAEEYGHITDTFVKCLIGDKTFEESDPTERIMLLRYISEADGVLSTMRTEGDPWELDMDTTEGLTEQYARIRLLARAYAIEGGKYYRDGGLLAKIKGAMEYMHENYYRSKSLHAFPVRNNWWDWKIGSAQFIVDILMLCGEGFSREEVDKYLAPVNDYVKYPSMTMANLVDMAYVCIAASALQRDHLRLVISRNKLYECLGLSTKGDGFYVDGSFIQHDIIPYSGSYGPIMIHMLSKIILAVSDTCFHVKRELIDRQYEWLVQSYIPLTYHGAFYGHVRGRSICRDSTDVSLGRDAVEGMLRMAKYTDDVQSGAIQRVLKEYSLYNNGHYLSEMDPYSQKNYKALMADETVMPREDFGFVKVFGHMDRAVATLDGYGVGISMSSSRIAKYEGMNLENGKGWYTGDGMVYIYTTVDDYSPEYWHNVNPYRLPGTTVTTAPRVDEDIKSLETLSKYDFVGGCSLGRDMAVAMQFESATDGMRGTKLSTPFDSSLKGKKAWFVLDGQVVCLGTDISSEDEYNTETIIENRRLPLTEKFCADGSTVDGVSGDLSGCRTLWIPDFGGVYLPGGGVVKFNRTSGEISFLEVYFDHGTAFTGGEYAYVLLPTVTKEECDDYANAPKIEILSNTDRVQAVKDAVSGTAGYIFHTAGSFGGVTVSEPCTVLVKGSEVAVADPTMKVETITVTVGGKEFTVAPKDGLTYIFNFS